MKKIFLLSTLMLSIFFCACNEDDIINLVPVGDTEASFYQNEEQMDMAVLGIYQKNCFFYGFRAGQNNYLASVYLLPSDDITTPQSNTALENFVNLQATTGQVNTYYQFAYQLISRANTILEKIEENGDFAYKVKPEQKNWNKGEALFLRAYMHMILWNVFGTAPKVTERMLDLDKAYLSNTKDTELLDLAIDDLEEAAKLLPTSWEAKYIGRLTKNSAWGLRSKALVFRGTVKKSQADFTAALADINSISGRSLMPKYGANFEITSENNAESLFEYQANNQSGNTNAHLNNDDFAVVGEITHYLGMYTQMPNWIGNMYFSATVPIKNAYDEGDPRKAYNINLAATGNVNIMKYLRVTEFARGAEVSHSSINNPRILRYADVLLLKAEALVRSGGSLSEAIGIINQIRERARNSDESGTPADVPADRDISETNRDTVLEWVFQERRLELAFEEGHRWWDLRRRHIAKEIDLKTYNFGSLNSNFKFEDYHIYFPLPAREVIANPNMNQNTGY